MIELILIVLAALVCLYLGVVLVYDLGYAAGMRHVANEIDSWLDERIKRVKQLEDERDERNKHD